MRKFDLSEEDSILSEEYAKINSKFYMEDFAEFFNKEKDFCYHRGLATDTESEWKEFVKNNSFINKSYHINTAEKEAYIQNCHLLENFHEFQMAVSKSIIPRFIHKEEYNFYEFGCGICPISYLILNFFKKYDPNSFINLNICDFHSHHFNFGIWRLYNYLLKNPELSCSIIDIESEDNYFPNLEDKQDVIYLMNILNFLPDPILALKKFRDQLAPNGIIVENFYRLKYLKPGHISIRDSFFEMSMKEIGFKKILTQPYEQFKKICIWELA